MSWNVGATLHHTFHTAPFAMKKSYESISTGILWRHFSNTYKHIFIWISIVSCHISFTAVHRTRRCSARKLELIWNLLNWWSTRVLRAVTNFINRFAVNCDEQLQIELPQSGRNTFAHFKETFTCRTKLRLADVCGVKSSANPAAPGIRDTATDKRDKMCVCVGGTVCSWHLPPNGLGQRIRTHSQRSVSKRPRSRWCCA